MSRYVAATAFGGPEGLRLLEEQVAAPGPGQVLLDVRAAGVNSVDAKMYADPSGDPASLPMRLGFEAAGVVAQVADGPDGAVGPAGPVSVGDEVIAFRVSGAYAERLVVDASAVVPKPASLDFAQAAGLLLTGATAVHALTAAAVSSGDTVLVHAASGGVGRMVVQLARLRGAHVVGTAGGDHLAELRALGVRAVEYGDGLADRVRAAAPDGVDAALDLVGTDEAVDVSLELVGDRSRIVSIAAFGRGADGIVLIGGGPGADPGTEIRDAARLELVRAVEEGTLHVLVSATYPLDDVAKAHEAIRAGHTRGKIALSTD
ncbi:MAG: quinone oxidoreductase family protein [Nocardioidaceae bacterium]